MMTNQAGLNRSGDRQQGNAGTAESARAVIYARHSTELQSNTSVDDQVRLCRDFIQRQGWRHLEVYSDRAMSGASALRPGYQRLLEDARADRFDIVVAEALDRLTRGSS
jgi:DNA invertase Pin-like site-specific DNA recombinase